MKRFKLQTGQTVVVDDCDAYLLRSYVWHGKTNRRGLGLTVARAHAGHTQALLSHEVLGIPQAEEAYVVHANGDVTDFRRANLRRLDREGWRLHMAALTRARRAEARLLGLKNCKEHPR